MSSNKLPTQHIIGEAVRNIVARPWLFAVGMLITFLIVSGAIVSDLAAVQNIQAKEQDFIAAGGDILIVKPASGGTIDALQCDSLRTLPGVYAAVGVEYLPAVSVLGRPEVNQNVMAVSWQIYDLLGTASDPNPLVVVAEPVAERWSLIPGNWLHLGHQDLPDTPLRITVVADLAKMGDVYSTAVLVGNGMLQSVDECLIGISLNYKEQVSDVVPALLGETSQSPVTISEVASVGRFGQQFNDAFSLRTTKVVGVLAGIAVGLFWAITSFARSGQMALYRSLGAGYWDVYAIRIIEQAVPLGLGVVNGAVSTSLLFTDGVMTQQTVLDIALRHGAAALLFALVTVMCTTLIQPRTLRALKHR